MQGASEIQNAKFKIMVFDFILNTIYLRLCVNVAATFRLRIKFF